MAVVVSKQAGFRTGGSGSRVLRVTALNTPVPYPPSAYAQHEIVLLAGKEYRLQGWLRSDPTNEFDLAIWSSRVDEGGADTVVFALTGTAAWTQFDETFTPTHDSYLRFGGIYVTTPTADFWFEFDDLTLWATEDVPTNPILYWTAGGSATLAKGITEVYEGLQSLSITASANDFSRQDVNLDERYATAEDAFVMFDGGSGVLRSRRLDPEPLS